jgi:hypothetical protein
MPKRNIISFEADDDVKSLLDQFLEKHPERGALTKLLNSSVREKHREAAKAVIQKEIAALEARARELDQLNCEQGRIADTPKATSVAQEVALAASQTLPKKRGGS